MNKCIWFLGILQGFWGWRGNGLKKTNIAIGYQGRRERYATWLPSARKGREGASPIGANLSDRVAGIGGEEGDEGEASSPLHDGTVPIDVPSCSGELASPVCSTRTEAAFCSRLWGLAPRLHIFPGETCRGSDEWQPLSAPSSHKAVLRLDAHLLEGKMLLRVCSCFQKLTDGVGVGGGHDLLKMLFQCI